MVANFANNNDSLFSPELYTYMNDTYIIAHVKSFLESLT